MHIPQMNPTKIITMVIIICHDQWTEAQAYQPKVSQYGSLNFQTFLRILFQRNSLFKQTFVDDVFFLPTNQFLEAVTQYFLLRE